MGWNPGFNGKDDANKRYEEKEIGEDDELIGFHGIKGKKQFISAIGLIFRRIPK